jgi:hypothetical protein
MRTAWLTSLVRTVLFAASCGFAAANIEPAFAGLNTNISISDNGTHIDRATIYVNAPFLTASGGVAPYPFSLDPTTPLPSGSGTLPTGLSLTAGGTLSGTPSATSSYTSRSWVRTPQGRLERKAIP